MASLTQTDKIHNPAKALPYHWASRRIPERIDVVFDWTPRSELADLARRPKWPTNNRIQLAVKDGLPASRSHGPQIQVNERERFIVAEVSLIV